MNEKEAMIAAMAEALRGLSAAVKTMLSNTIPFTPLPRPRIFHLGNGWVWPHVNPPNMKKDIDWYEMKKRMERDESWKPITLSCTPEELCAELMFRPRAVLRFIRRLQAAAAWCQARARGRQRAAAEIVKQQQNAVKAIEAEVIIKTLK